MSGILRAPDEQGASSRRTEFGQQVLEVVIFGYDKPEEAEAAFRREVVSMIQTEPGPVEKAEQSPDFSSAPPLPTGGICPAEGGTSNRNFTTP